ncbi:Hypothetical predicted protein [Pelobates cultripes]|uniref:Uncharacterized protein n=1 Tax=Pelobates cultripes TaxID=61616 RepID=A0AAD1R7B7_PELCU|nr:Hypothetical predicted protein [Pelobates cultripes]
MAALDDFKTPESLTKYYFEQAMEAMSAKLIHTWQSTADQLRKEDQDLNTRTSHVEKECKEFTSSHNDMVDHVQALKHKLELMEIRMADSEDRA